MGNRDIIVMMIVFMVFATVITMWCSSDKATTIHLSPNEVITITYNNGFFVNGAQISNKDMSTSKHSTYIRLIESNGNSILEER